MSSRVDGHAEDQPLLAPSPVPGSMMSMIGDDATIQNADRNDFISSLRDAFKTVVNFNFLSHASSASERTENDRNSMQLDPIAVLPFILEAIRSIQRQPQVGEMASIGNSGTLTQSEAEIPRNQVQPEAGEITDSRARPQDLPTNHTPQCFPQYGIVNVIDIVLSNPSSSPVPASIADKYTRCMMKCLAGYPLYEPQPFSDLSEEYLIEGIRAGDVGFIREDGAFDFLFNICPSQNDSINPPDLPSGFTLQGPQDSKIRYKKQFAPKTHLFHEPISRAEGLLGCHKYTCSGAEGAILELPEGASQFEAINVRPFKDFAVCRGVEWYRYTMLRGRDITNGSLYLVTSSTKCTHWGIALLMKPCAKRQGLQFVRNRSFCNSNLKYCWKGSCASTTMVAPTPDPHHRNALNQCVFLRGYKIMLREDIWNDLDEERRRENFDLAMSSSSPPQTGNTMRQAAPSNQVLHRQSEIRSDTRPCLSTSGPRTDAKEHQEDSINPDLPVIVPPVKETGEVILHADFNKPPVHPSDLINIALLNQEPSAKLAITHDDTWCDLLRDILDSKTLDLARIAQSYTSLIDEYGCISFEKAAFKTNHGNQIIGDQQQVPATFDGNHGSIVQMPPALSRGTSQRSVPAPMPRVTNAGSGELDMKNSKFDLNMSDNQTHRPSSHDSPSLFRSLIITLKKYKSVDEAVANQEANDRLSAFLNHPSCGSFIKKDEISDPNEVKFLMEFILCSTKGSGLHNKARSGARRILIKLAKTFEVTPESIKISPGDIVIDLQLSMTEMGGYSDMLKGRFRGKSVVLKRIHKNTEGKCFYQEAVLWHTLSHKHILPFLGIYVNEVKNLLVSPLMENGTLSDWRNGLKSISAVEIHDIQKHMMAVADGLQYLHEEGIVHGDVRGSNVLLDEYMVVKIADFGSSRHPDATWTTDLTASYHFSAPEQFPDDDDDDEEEDEKEEAKYTRTQKMDVYSFACLYYEIHYNRYPFYYLKHPYTIGKNVRKGRRPNRLPTPALADKAWKLIGQCWREHPGDRPNMYDVLQTMRAWS